MSCLRCQSVLGRFRNEAENYYELDGVHFQIMFVEMIDFRRRNFESTCLGSESFAKVVVRLSHTMW